MFYLIFLDLTARIISVSQYCQKTSEWNGYQSIRTLPNSNHSPKTKC